MKKNIKNIVAAAVIIILGIVIFYKSAHAPSDVEVTNNTALETPYDIEEVPDNSPTSLPAETKKPEITDKTLSPVPEDKSAAQNIKPSESPAPVPEVQTTSAPESGDNKENTCTLSISCINAINSDKLSESKRKLLPSDGVILSLENVEFSNGESAFDILRRELKRNSIHMEYNTAPMSSSSYIEGIANLYEFDCGDGSGWLYKVNGDFLEYSSSQYTVKSGDSIEWVYSCDFGADVGSFVPGS